MSTYDSTNTGTALGAFVLIWILIYVALIVLMVIAWWKIASKAGYSGAWALILFVPIANIIFFLIFAFSKWPILQELEFRRQQGGVPPSAAMPPYPPQYR